ALFQTTPAPSSIMSQHSSLKSSGSVGTKRSVLKRGERIKLLKARGQWKEGRLPTNLPKTKPE
ncbi:MAG: small basic protein, partial [Prosthecobacter sp.]